MWLWKQPPRATNTREDEIHFDPGRSPMWMVGMYFLCGVLVAWGGCGPDARREKSVIYSYFYSLNKVFYKEIQLQVAIQKIAPPRQLEPVQDR